MYYQEKNNQSEKNIVGVSCKICRRTFSSFSTHKNHLLSKRHLNAEAKELQILRKTLQEQSQAYIEKSKFYCLLVINWFILLIAYFTYL